MHSVTEVEQGKRVLVRLDLDVPFKKGKIVDDSRLKTALPTLKLLIKKKSTMILIGHRGRPHGKHLPELSVRPVATHLSKLLHRKILFVSAATKISNVPARAIAMLENLRFNKGEEENSAQFANTLAKNADAYVNESFATSHDTHASIVGLPKHLPSYAGLHLCKEVKTLSSLLKHTRKPFVIVMGGAKINDKLPVLKKLLPHADTVLMGGIIANTALTAAGISLGKTVVEFRSISVMHNLIKNKKLFFPIDFFCARTPFEKPELFLKNKVPTDYAAYDLGIATIQQYKRLLQHAKTVLWNGPLGLVEQPSFAQATIALATYLAKRKITSIITGGDTAAVIHKLGLSHNFTHLSTGGGAALQFLAGKKLVGLVALNNK